jgi:MYXO-CTERM domain-containing protein
MAGFGAGFNQFTGAPDRLFLNPATDGNNWIKVNLTGVESNRSAIGAVIQITGSWGTQTREIRAGESYGISHSLTEHFGLGADETVATMTITWPSGTVDVIEDIDGNQTVNISEGCQTEYFTDADGDGFGDPDSGQASCFAPKGSVEDGTDCDDDNENNYPGNAEVCDGEDNNCDGTADEGLEDCDAGSSSGGEDTDGDSDSDSDSDGPTTDSDSTTGPVDPTSDSDSDTEGDTDDSAGAGGGGGGCAVATPTTDAAFLLMLLGLGAPLARRRKRC